MMRNRLLVTLTVGVLIAPGVVYGQTASTTPAMAPATPASAAATPATAANGLTFEVASVRKAAPIDQATIFAGLRAGRRPESMRLDGLRATYTYMSLKELIASGYRVRTYQVSGPDWLASDRFDIVAKLPDGAKRDDVPAMMQALLAERFKLAAHLETKENPVLGLMLAKGATKLEEAPVPGPIDVTAPLKPGETKVDGVDGPIILTRNGDGSTTYNMGTFGAFTLKVDGENGEMHMTAKGMSLKGFAMMMTTLGGGNGKQVVDMTGLNGHYNLEVKFSLSDLVSSLRDSGIEVPVGPRAGGGGGAGSAASDPGGDSTVSDALANIGLKLEKTKANVEQLVVDHVEKTATEN